ncbi:hypothetical protein [Raoultella planticola]|uniref:hypothetical protein n=1 Tax=Raoultella planticola TaxID=575 RepID=UPI0025AA3265|nr:hypothetical protein [Raoultella planticola]MDM9666595.1 hypothetical protein [Raoultella planticola]
MCQALILKYSNADPEQLLGVIPLEEVAELMRLRIRQQVQNEVESELMDRVATAEDEASEAEGRADDWQQDAEWLYQSIKEALDHDWETAKETLRSALNNSQAG